MLRLLTLLAAGSAFLLACSIHPEERFWTACKEEVKKQLKAPRSAVFPDKPDINIILKSGKALIIADVDAQNSFGALLRSKFQCMRHFGNNTDETISVVIKDSEALSSSNPQNWVPQLAATQFMIEVLAEQQKERK